jgi:hypothetical protein
MKVKKFIFNNIYRNGYSTGNYNDYTMNNHNVLIDDNYS